MSDNANENLIRIGRYGTAVEAHLAKNRLEEAGIPAVVSGAEFGSALPMTTGLSAIEVHVRESDLFRASEMLDADDDAHAAAASDAIQAAGALTAPGRVRAADDDDDAEPILSEREEHAHRAYRGAILGCLFWPIQFYVSYLLLKVFLAESDMKPEYSRQARIAAVINAPFVLIILYFLRLLVGDLVR